MDTSLTQCPEAFAVPVSAGLAEIRVDHDDLLDGPAERMGPRAQRVLAMGALGVLRHLAQCRLADVETGIPGKMAGLSPSGAHCS